MIEMEMVLRKPITFDPMNLYNCVCTNTFKYYAEY